MTFPCEFCGKNYSYQKNLNLHLRKAHGMEKGITSFPFDTHKHKCLEGCNVSFRLITDLRQHLKQDHGKVMNPDLLAFSSMRDFKMWFDNLTKQNNVTYYRGSTTKSGIYFFCNRSGVSRVKGVQNRKRALKKQGSCKIQHSCTNQIILLEKDEKVLVTYYKEHYGHKEEIQHLRLPRRDVLLIASKMASGESPAKIINEARLNRDNNNIKRVDLINRKDLRNIRTALGLKTAEMNKPTTPPIVHEYSDPGLPENPLIESDDILIDKQTSIANIKTRLFEVLENIRNECSTIDGEEELTEFYEKLKQYHSEIIAIKTKSLQKEEMVESNIFIEST